MDLKDIKDFREKQLYNKTLSDIRGIDAYYKNIKKEHDLILGRLGLDSEINKLAREFNKSKSEWDKPLIEKLTKSFESIGLNEKELAEIKPEKEDEKVSAEKFQNDFQNTQMEFMRSLIDTHSAILIDLRNKPTERRWDFIKLLAAGIVGAICTGLISWLLLKAEKPTQVFPIIHLKNQTVHDTIYIASPNTSKDTSFVRIVK